MTVSIVRPVLCSCACILSITISALPMRAALALTVPSSGLARSTGKHLNAKISRPDRIQYREFVRTLLKQKDPRRAYEFMAAPEMIQHQPPFGTDRSSTIKQWESMAALPKSRFALTSVRFRGDIAEVRFHGVLDPEKPGAEVIVRDRLERGKIVEEWGEFRPSKP